jgi:hypothetical protein
MTGITGHDPERAVTFDRNAPPGLRWTAAQTIETTFAPVHLAHIRCSFSRECLAFPITVSECVQLRTSAIGFGRSVVSDVVCPPRNRTCAPEIPRSLSIVWMRSMGQPSAMARSRKPYWRKKSSLSLSLGKRLEE